jgi:prevent-host-death family protein
MDNKVKVHEAKTHLSKLLQCVMNGERFIITKAGKPVAVLAPIDLEPEARIPGNDAGKVVLAADFDAPLPEFEK